MAAQYGNIGAIAALINRGADIHAQDNDGKTLLHEAVWNKRKAVYIIKAESATK